MKDKTVGMILLSIGLAFITSFILLPEDAPVKVVVLELTIGLMGLVVGGLYILLPNDEDDDNDEKYKYN